MAKYAIYRQNFCTIGFAASKNSNFTIIWDISFLAIFTKKKLKNWQRQKNGKRHHFSATNFQPLDLQRRKNPIWWFYEVFRFEPFFTKKIKENSLEKPKNGKICHFKTKIRFFTLSQIEFEFKLEFQVQITFKCLKSIFCSLNSNFYD